jgi:hypothetical protein
MKLPGILFVCGATALLLASPCARAADPSGSASLESLRKQYDSASETAAANNRPRLKDPNFSQKLSRWIRIQREQADVGHRLAGELIKLWAAASDGSPQLHAIEQELHDLCQEMTEPPSTECIFFSAMVRPYVMPGGVTKARAAFLASLTVPNQRIHFYDRRAKLGIPGPSWGWEIQDTYAVALARAGQVKQARDENKLLLTKVNLLLKQGQQPEMQPDALQKKRSFLVHRALLEWLSGEREAAQSFLDDAGGLSYLGEAAGGDAEMVAEVQKGLAAGKK